MKRIYFIILIVNVMAVKAQEVSTKKIIVENVVYNLKTSTTNKKNIEGGLNISIKKNEFPLEQKSSNDIIIDKKSKNDSIVFCAKKPIR
jgi:hypothetical protein